MNWFTNKELYYFVNGLCCNDKSHKKYRAYRSTKKKRDIEKIKKRRKIAKKSKRKNRSK